MSQSSGASRREFLRRSVAASAAFSLPMVLPAEVLGRGGAVAPNSKINLGVIGIGPRCTYDLKVMLEMPDIHCVAISDVQASRRNAGKELVDNFYKNKDLALYRDFREMLARKDIDAVLIATGDRWHALASIMAAEAGKDVYAEKPCAMTIALAQKLDETFKRTGRIFQAGTQRRSVPNFIEAVKLAHSGKLGKLKTLHASIYEPGLANPWLPGQPTPPKDVCDWNLWLGQAPWRPYNIKYVQGGWRGIYDFDAGAKVLEWGVHTLDLCQWANNSDDTMPIEYEATDKAILCNYANGVKLSLDYLKTPFGERTGWIQSMGTCPVRFVGEEGWVETGDSGQIEVNPESLKKELKALDKKMAGTDVATHARNFVDSIKSRKPAVCNSTVMRRSHIACHAAALCFVLGRKLKLDPATETFIGDEEANSLRSRPARDPFKV